MISKGDDSPQASTTKGEPTSKVGPTASPQNKVKTRLSVQKPTEQPVAHRTRSRTKIAEIDVMAAIVSDLLAALVMDEDTREMLEFRQLRSHPN